MNFSDYYKKQLIPDNELSIKNNAIIRIDSIYNKMNNLSFKERSEKLILLKKNLFELILEIKEETSINISKFTSVYDILKNSLEQINKNEGISELLFVKVDDDKSLEYFFDSQSPSKSSNINNTSTDYPLYKHKHDKLIQKIEIDINLVLIIDIYADYIFMFLLLLSTNIKKIRKINKEMTTTSHESKVEYYDYYCENSNLKEYVEIALVIRKTLIQFTVKTLTIGSFIDYNIKKCIDIFAYILNVEFIYMYNVDYFLSIIKVEILDFLDFWFIINPENKRKELNKEEDEKSKKLIKKANKQKENNKTLYDKYNKNQVQTKSILKSNSNPKFKKTAVKVQIISSNINNTSKKQIRNDSKNSKNKSISNIELSNATKSLYVCLLFDINTFLFNIKEFNLAQKISDDAFKYFKNNFNMALFDNDCNNNVILSTETKTYLIDKVQRGIISTAMQEFKQGSYDSSQNHLKFYFQTVNKLNIQNMEQLSNSIVLYSKILYENERYQDSLDKLMILTSDGPNEYGIKIEKSSITIDSRAQAYFWKSKNFLKLNNFEAALLNIEEYIKDIELINSAVKYFSGIKLKLNIITKLTLSQIEQMRNTISDDTCAADFNEYNVKNAENIAQNESWISIFKNLNSIFIDFSSSKYCFPFDTNIVTDVKTKNKDNANKYSQFKENADLTIEYCSCLKYQLKLISLLKACKNNNDNNDNSSTLIANKLYKEVIPKELMNLVCSSLVSSSLINEKLNKLQEAEECLIIGKNLIIPNNSNNLIESETNSYNSGSSEFLENRIHIIFDLDPNLLLGFFTLTDNLGSFFLSTDQIIKGIREFELNSMLFSIINKDGKARLETIYTENALKELSKKDFYNKWKYSEAYSLLNSNNLSKQVEIISNIFKHEFWHELDLETKVEIIEKHTKTLIDLKEYHNATSFISKEITFIERKIEKDLYPKNNYNCDMIIETIITVAYYMKDKFNGEYFESIMLVAIRFCDSFNLFINKIDTYVKIGLGYKADDNFPKALYYLKQAEAFIYSDASSIVEMIQENKQTFEEIKKKLIFNLGIINMSLENFSTAEDYLKTAFEINTDNPKKQGDCSSALALCRENMGDISEATGYYQTTLILRERVYGQDSKAYQVILNKINLLSMS